MKKTLSYPQDLLLKFVLCIGVLLIMTCNAAKAQSYTFTPKTGKVSAGTFAHNGTFTLSFIFTSDYNTDHWRRVQMWQHGNNSGALSYERDDATIEFTIKGQKWSIISKYAYDIITNQKPDTLIWSYDGVTAKFILNSMLVEAKAITSLPQPVNAQLILSADPIVIQMPGYKDTVPMDCMTGKITNLSLIQGGYTLKTTTLPTFALDSNDYPTGFNIITGDISNCRKAKEQFNFYKYPVWKSTIYSGTAFNAAYLAEQGQSGVTWQQVQTNVGAITDTLCSKFKSVLKIDNAGQLYFNPESYQSLIALHLAKPEYKVDITSQLSQMDAVDGHTPLTKAQIDYLMPNTPNTTFYNEQYNYKKYAEKLRLTFAEVRLWQENDEWLSWFPDTVRYQANLACRAAKEATGLTWKQYCSKRHAEIFNYIFAGVESVYPNAIINRYDVYASSVYPNPPLIQYEIAVNTDGHSSSSLYPEAPYNIKNGGGNQRGLFYYFDNKMIGLNYGITLDNTYVGAGWNADPRLNISPAQLSGLYTIIMGGGVGIPQPGYFVIGGGLPQPTASYAFQCVMQAYVLAGLSNPNVWDLYVNSKLLKGDLQNGWYRVTNQPPNYNGQFWTGLKYVPCVVRQGTVRIHEYLIFTGVIKPDNKKDPMGVFRTGKIVLNGVEIPIESKIAGRIYKYNDQQPISENNPKIIFTGRTKHPDRIPQDTTDADNE